MHIGFLNDLRGHTLSFLFILFHFEIKDNIGIRSILKTTYAGVIEFACYL